MSKLDDYTKMYHNIKDFLSENSLEDLIMILNSCLEDIKKSTK